MNTERSILGIARLFMKRLNAETSGVDHSSAHVCVPPGWEPRVSRRAHGVELVLQRPILLINTGMVGER